MQNNFTTGKLPAERMDAKETIKTEEKMKTGKIIIATVVVTIFNAIVGAVTCGGIFNWVYKLEPINVWKPMEVPGIAYYIGTILLNLIFVLAYAVLRTGIPGKNKLVKGLVFGLCVWGIGVLPGMFATYMFMTVAPTVIIYLTIMGLVQDPLKGLITAAIYGEQKKLHFASAPNPGQRRAGLCNAKLR